MPNRNHLSTIGELSEELEVAITHVIGSTTRNAWDENHLTHTWLKEVQPLLHGRQFVWRGLRRSIACRLFKLKGKVEQHHGDVAVLLRIQFQDGEVLSGVSFLEAKVRDWDDDRFPALKVRQLERQYSKTRNARVLLYERMAAAYGAGCVPHWGHVRDFSDEGWHGRPVTHGLVVPMALLSEKSRQNQSVYRYASPLSCHIAHRLLLGLDLEFDPKVIAEATRAADRENISTLVLSVGVRVSAMHGPAVQLEQVTTPDLGSGEYEPVE